MTTISIVIPAYNAAHRHCFARMFTIYNDLEVFFNYRLADPDVYSKELERRMRELL